MFSRRKNLKMAILIVNGKFNYKDHLWIELAIKNILRFTSPYIDFKIFVWNHDYENPRVIHFFESCKDRVEIVDEKNFDLTKWQGIKCDVPPERGYKGNYFGGGFHVHRAALQMLYEKVIKNYNVDIIFTFDSDSWPIRNNWDIPLVYLLEKKIKLTGIWRDELRAVIPPYIHPSCLGIKAETIAKLNLRFDYEPLPPTEDTLSHFTQLVRQHFGEDVIYPLKRSNLKEYHPVFNGVYGGIIYHHHLGTRYKDGKLTAPQTYGWQERGESLTHNKFILDATTRMIFEQTDDFILALAYGDRAFGFKLYSNYLQGNTTDEGYIELLETAKERRGKDLPETYYISGLIVRHFAFDKEFLQFYAEVCEEMGYAVEAESYYYLARSNESRSSR